MTPLRYGGAPTARTCDDALVLLRVAGGGAPPTHAVLYGQQVRVPRVGGQAVKVAQASQVPSGTPAGAEGGHGAACADVPALVPPKCIHAL